jgi:DNA-binding MurR/RpiR family transcriptional regulator
VERRIAAAVLADPAVALDKTITELAAEFGVSPASVARFCRGAGFDGYREFQLSIAGAVSREQVSLDRFGVADSDIAPDDAVADVVAKIAYHEARTIQETADALDLATLDTVVERILAAPRVDIYGVASSGLASADLQQKLHRIGLISYAWTDAHLALTSAALLGPGSVAIGLSHSGLSIETNHALRAARDAGATTVAITNFPNSPLARLADLVLTTTARETRYRSGAMSSRIAQLAVVDFIFVRIAQRSFGQTSESLRRTYEAVQAHRLAYDDTE